MKQNSIEIKSAESKQYSKKAAFLTNVLCGTGFAAMVVIFTVVFLRGCANDVDRQVEQAKQHQAQFVGVKS